MKRTGDIERLLAQTPPARVVEGPHRQLLKRQLLHLHAPRSVPVVRLRWKPVLAWAACAVLVFGVVQVVIWGWVRSLSSEKAESYHMLTLLDGGGVLSSDPDYTIAEAVRHYEEVGDLIRQGKHELVQRIDLDEDRAVLVYQVVLSNGKIAFCTRVVPPAGGGDKNAMWVRVAQP